MSVEPVEGSHFTLRELSFEPLTPTNFLHRASKVHADRVAVVDGSQRYTYAQLDDRCRRTATALRKLANGAPIATLLPNSHVALETHFAIPWAGSALVPLNTRLRPAELAVMLRHSGSRVLVYDDSLSEIAEEASEGIGALFLVRAGGQRDDYESMQSSRPVDVRPLTDERSLLSINYTSGTTGKPKGAMYHHRGAYLQALAMVVHARLTPEDGYLWTLPMFHCHGWCFPWAVTAAGATHFCLRQVNSKGIWSALSGGSVSVFCGAPTVLTMVAYAEDAAPVHSPVRVLTGGAPPVPTVIERLERLGVSVIHLYGLTETFGPAVVCEWKPEWNRLDIATRSRKLSRQGVGNIVATPPRVIDKDGHDVPADGESLGEIALRGNNVMLGYYNDERETRASIHDGWFLTGDVAVVHRDGYIEIRDRSKDVIISGGENVSSVEVEAAVSMHPAVLECAVVGVPDTEWGEVPAAFVTLKAGRALSEPELRRFVRERIAHYKTPKYVFFEPLPKTATGKIQKFELRRTARRHIEDDLE